MPKEYILTMTAANRIGILSAVTRALAELGCDLRELSQTVVRGYFTMIFSAEFPDGLSDDVVRAHVQDACRAFHIDVGIKDPAKDGQTSDRDRLRKVHTLRIGGENKPGVLRSLSSLISLHRVDIVGMRAVRVSDRSSFEMVMRIAVPTDFDLPKFRHDLEQAEREIALTVELKADS